jgi:hypothetical protein
MALNSPRRPFPSFTLALSRQGAGDHNESNIGIHAGNASKVESPIDLMVGLEHPTRSLSMLTLSLSIENI